MSPLERALTVERVTFLAAAENARALLANAAELLSSAVLPADPLAAALATREARGSTGLGRGVAIPHARLAGLDSPRAAVIRLAEPLDWSAPDGSPVDLYFVLIVPEAASEAHLQILAEVAKQFASPRFRDAVRAAATPAEVHRLFLTWRSELT